MKLATTNYLSPSSRLALLQHEGLLHHNGKTGKSIMRYGAYPVVAVLDHTQVGGSIRELTGIDCDAPIVASMKDAFAYRPDVLLIGIAPSGGALTDEWLDDVEAAAKAGLSIVNGLHSLLADHPRVKPHLREGQWVWDIRKEPEGLEVGSGKARELSCLRVLTVGTDMAVGKMSTSIELHREAAARGLRSQFVASGQTGLMLCDQGIPLDCIRVDFAAGSVEQAVRKAGKGSDIVFVEGQGSFCNPASTATLPLLRGSQPTHQILVHRAGQTHLSTYTHVEIPPLANVVSMYEVAATAGGAFAPAPVVGVALNTGHMNDAEAREAISQARRDTGLVCTDPIRFGPGPLLDAILQEREDKVNP